MKQLVFLLRLSAVLLVSVTGLRAAKLPETCYLFAYFYHDREGEGFRLAWSVDGYAFEMLNHGQGFLHPTAGEHKLMRDPTLIRDESGLFHLVWTTGWTGKTIGYASSKDLLTWSEQKTLPVMAHEPEAQNSWAPEILWVPEEKHFLLHWSSTIFGRFPATDWTNRRPERNHRIYGTTTKDFKTFSPTFLIYDAGYNVIDANYIPAADGTTDWLMFVKEESLTPVTQKNIRLVRGRTPTGPWDRESPPITGDYWAEGPAAIKVGDEYRVYFDKHMVNAIGMVRSRDLVHWEDVSDRIIMPADARHGCILEVPRDVVERLLAAQAKH